MITNRKIKSLVLSFFVIFTMLAAPAGALAAIPTDIEVNGFHTGNGADTVTVDYSIYTIDAPAFDLSFYLSSDALPDMGDTLLSTVSVSAPSDLTVGVHAKTFVLGVDISLVDNISPVLETGGDYYLLAVADPSNGVAETNETNNSAPFVGLYQYPGSGHAVFVHGSDAGDSLTSSDAGGNTTLTFNGNPFVYSNASFGGLFVRSHGGSDIVDLSGGVAFSIPQIYGGSGSDLIQGSSRPDVIDGGADGDTIYGNAGTDTLTGGTGNDYLDGGSNNDRILGDAGADTIVGGSGTDILDFRYAPAKVVVNLLTLTALLDGYGSSDSVSGIENVNGTNFDDQIMGDANPNGLNGGNGNDILMGRGGADVLGGGTGNDTIYAFSNQFCNSDNAADLIDGGIGVNSGSWTAEDTATNINSLCVP